MVDSRQLAIPFYRDIGQQRGRGFGAHIQNFGRTAIPRFRENIFPPAKRVDADLLEFDAQKFAEVVGGRKNFKTAAKNVG